MTELITSSLSSVYVPIKNFDLRVSGEYGIGTQEDFTTIFSHEPAETINATSIYTHGIGTPLDLNTQFLMDGDLKYIDTTSVISYDFIPAVDRITGFKYYAVDVQADKLGRGDYKYVQTLDFDLSGELGNNSTDFFLPIDPETVRTRLSPVDTVGSDAWKELPIIDVDSTYNHNGVNLTASKPNFGNYRYIPTSNFRITEFEIVRDVDFSEPVLSAVTPLSPVDGSTDLPWKDAGDLITRNQRLTYGYSINKFLVGGSTNANYPVDEDALLPPTPPPVLSSEVINIVNIINVVVLPERTPIQFTNLTLATDLSSIAWVANFDIADQASLDLIKPQGMSVKEVEINVNGALFNVFIGRTSTSIVATKESGPVRRIKCVGWSNVKRLSYPYESKKSHTEASGATPSGILVSELAGTGFTATWHSVSWTLPSKVFGYVDKAPLAAITDLVNAVGAVIIPHVTDDSFTVEPYYPISPWNWDTATPDFYLSENSFFTIDTEWIPHESADSIYVYGEEQGVGVKCVKSGTAGLVTLPTVIDKHITDTIAGTERGRIEVAKNGFKEIIPVTTYIDGNGIIMPQSLLEVTDTSENTWRGMVIGTKISIKRVGNAVIQSLKIERHYD